jgi:hypothetical protein
MKSLTWGCSESGVWPLSLLDMTPHWKFWMQFISPIQLIHWNTAGSLKICTAFQIPSFKVHGIHVSPILSRAISVSLATSRLSPLQDTPLVTMIDLMQAFNFWHREIWSTHSKWSDFDMKRFWHLIWANLTSCKFSLILFKNSFVHFPNL